MANEPFRIIKIRFCFRWQAVLRLGEDLSSSEINDRVEALIGQVGVYLCVYVRACARTVVVCL